MGGNIGPDKGEAAAPEQRDGSNVILLGGSKVQHSQIRPAPQRPRAFAGTRAKAEQYEAAARRLAAESLNQPKPTCFQLLALAAHFGNRARSCYGQAGGGA